MNSGQSILLFVIVTALINDKCISSHKVYLKNDVDVTSYPSVGNKFQRPVLDGVSHRSLENSIFKTRANNLKDIFRSSVDKIKMKSKNVDIIFLIDSSSSIGKVNFHSEINFVKKVIGHFDLSFNYTRIALITFSSHSKVKRHIDQISSPNENHDQCSAITNDIPRIEFFGGGTYTYGALKDAQTIFKTARPHSRKYIFLVTDGFSNGRNPIPVAEEMKANNVTIFTIGIKSGNSDELYNISSYPKETHNFLLTSFKEFEKLARGALVQDHQLGYSIKLSDSNRCNVLCEGDHDYPKDRNATFSCCNPLATCECRIPSGHYSCSCPEGYVGEGLGEDCLPCVRNTYWIDSFRCMPCPDINHVTLVSPALTVEDCICKPGFKKTADNHCEGITCPKLSPPENGYFVTQPSSCANVLNAACGTRCKSGYQLIGSSLRLCQENGTWSGSEAQCILKTCPSLSVPLNGMITCQNHDLELTSYDYTPHNDTFMLAFKDASKRRTEPMPIDTECNYKCGQGHYLVGSKNRNCLPISKWDGRQTTCKRVLCPPIAKPKYGRYNLPGCTKSKQAYGTNCTLICPEGFTLKGAETKICSGKKVGAWTPKYRTSKCVDTTPPKLVCPQNYTIDLPLDSDSVVLFILPPPLEAQDSSTSTFSIWTKPSVDDTTGVRLKIGHHTFTYFASDKFNNKAECNFRVTVLDQTPPSVEHCVDPEVFWISKNDSSSQIEWEEPVFTDNSNEEVAVRLLTALDPRKVVPPVAGEFTLLYTASDHSKNFNECLLNVTVKEFSCDPLPAPKHGLSYCAKNSTHSWCEVTCDLGYALFDEESGEYLDNLRLHCDYQHPGWKYTTLPDCTALGLPESVGQSFTITMDSENPLCANQDAFAGSLSDQMKAYLCSNLTDCDLISEIPECIQEGEIDENFPLGDREKYHISKREAPFEVARPRKNKKRVRSSVRIRLYTRISKRLGLWQKNNTLSENIRQMKYQVQSLDMNEPLKKILKDMHIDIRRLKIEDFIRCPDGSVSKRNICFQCARGTYQDAAFNRCKLCPLGSYNPDFGKTMCLNCPSFYSTRREGRLLQSDCKAQCPPGTWAKVRGSPRKFRPGITAPHSLMPFCRKCPAGEFQPSYDQTRCLHCPASLTSSRGATSIQDCTEPRLHICEKDSTICGPFGRCVPESGGDNLYSCECPEGYIGAQCEQKVDPCHSAPCFNNGICTHVNETTVGCHCLPEFTGIFCEELKNSCDTIVCKNGGSCMELEDGDAACECPSGFEGRFCEERVNYCDSMPCETGFCHSHINGYSCQCPPGVIGRRCHLRPCDNFPCHPNAICVDLMHLPATRRSYECKCPPGLKGTDCMQIDNPCDDNPCVNNGICQPVAVRQLRLNVSQIRSVDESDYKKVTCSCLPYFYGNFCELFIKPDYSMKFQKPSIQNYVQIDGPQHDLTELSFCTWIKTRDIFTYGSVISYANDKYDNAFTLTDYSGFFFYVNGNFSATDIVANDGEWHFICATWTSENGYHEIYFDGKLEHVGMNLSAGEYIYGGGVFVIGQEQDRLGGGFSESESFIGEIAYMDIWDSFLSGEQIHHFYSNCDPYRGSLYSWTDFKTKVRGDIEILPSTFCQKCPEDLYIANGFVIYNGTEAAYHCQLGYILRGPITVRHCLRTSKWSPGVPYCELINCGKLIPPENGAIEYSAGTTLHSVAKYVCNTDFILEGNDERFCPITGVWSGTDPVCMSSVLCEKLDLSDNFKIIYINDKGMIPSNLMVYPLGVYAEVTCLLTNSDYFLTCMDDGTWDGILPDCLPPEPTVAVPLTTIFIPSPGINDLPTTSTENIKHLTLDLSIPIDGQPFDFESTVEDNHLLESIRPASIEFFVSSEAPVSLEEQTIPSSTVSQAPKRDYIFPEHYKDFWPLLYEFLYKGCLDEHSDERLLCAVKSKPIPYTNLYTSEMNSFEKFPNLDVQLLELIHQHIKDITRASLTGGVPYEDFFDMLLFGNNFPNAERLNSDLENSLRFTLCILIDAIAWDARNGQTAALEDGTDMENRTALLKKLIRQLGDFVYENFRIRFINNKKQYTTTEASVVSKIKKSTKRDAEDRKYYSEEDGDEWGELDGEFSGCDWGGLPEAPENGIIMQIWDSETFAVGSEVQYGCELSYELKGSMWNSKCVSNGQWSQLDYTCVLTWCAAPAILPNMKLNNPASRFRIGDVVSFDCIPGFSLSSGSNSIECLSNGAWSKLTTWCRRISCKHPIVPSKAVIVKGSHNLFEDKVGIKCPNGKITEITCESDGHWSKNPSEICPVH